MSDEPVLEPQALSKFDEAIIDSFAKDLVGQAMRMDELAKYVITINLAIPGLYAAVLKFNKGGDAVVSDISVLVMTFSAWLLACAFAFLALLPERYALAQDDLSSMQAYFTKTAQRKYRLILIASVCSLFGMAFAIFGIFI
jgi:hypothetical protein